MIDLPQSIKVTRNPQDEAGLVSRAKEWLQSEERAPGIHASELLDLRRAYFQRVDPKSMDDRSALVFLVGKVLHAFILGAQSGGTYKDGVGKTDEGSFESSELGITFSPDRNQDGVIRELKTSRAMYEPKTVGDLRVYLEQLLIYMAAEDLLRAKLDVLYLNLKDERNRTTPQIRVYDIEVDQAGLEVVKQQIKSRVAALKSALAHEAHKDLPLCREWLCGELMCPWWAKCKPEGRWGDPKFLLKKPVKKGPAIEGPETPPVAAIS
jgi:hypothetical protein